MNESGKRGRKPSVACSHAHHVWLSLAAILECGAFALVLLLTWSSEALAYIDPNAGGFIAQILAPLGAIFLSLLFYCRREIRRFATALRARLRRGGAPARPDARESGK